MTKHFSPERQPPDLPVSSALAGTPWGWASDLKGLGSSARLRDLDIGISRRRRNGMKCTAGKIDFRDNLLLIY